MIAQARFGSNLILELLDLGQPLILDQDLTTSAQELEKSSSYYDSHQLKPFVYRKSS